MLSMHKISYILIIKDVSNYSIDSDLIGLFNL